MKHCSKCGAFLRKDGGCTRCEKEHTDPNLERFFTRVLATVNDMDFSGFTARWLHSDTEYTDVLAKARRQVRADRLHDWLVVAEAIRVTGWTPDVPAGGLDEWPSWGGLPHRLIVAAAKGIDNAFKPKHRDAMNKAGISPLFVLLDQLTRLRDHVDRERGIQLAGRSITLTKGQMDLAGLWLAYLSKNGQLEEMMASEMLGSVTPSDLNMAEAIADARALLSDAWGVVDDGHFDAVKSKLDHEQRALAALIMYVELLSKDDPELPTRLLWAIVLSFEIGEHRESDEDSRLAHVNHELSRSKFPGQLLPDPIGGDFDFDMDGELQGEFLRRDTFIDNLQVNKEVSLGRTRAKRKKDKPTDLGTIVWGNNRKPVPVTNMLRALGLSGVWIPNDNKAWCSWKPVGLMRRALMSLLRKLAAEAQTVVDSGGYNVCLTEHHMRMGKLELTFKANPKAPFRLTVPIDVLLEEAYHLRHPENHRFTPLRGAYRNPELVTFWEAAKELRRGPQAEQQLMVWNDTVKKLTNGLTPKQAVVAARERNHMRLRGAILGASKPNLACGKLCCRPLVKMWRRLHSRPLFIRDMERIKKDVAAGLLFTNRELVRWIWMAQNQRLHTGLTRNGTHVIEVAVFGDVKDLFRELIGLPGGPPSDRATRRNGVPATKASLAQLAENVPELD